MIVAFKSSLQCPNILRPMNLAGFFPKQHSVIYPAVNVPHFCKCEQSGFVIFCNPFSLSTKTVKNITSCGITFVEQEWFFSHWVFLYFLPVVRLCGIIPGCWGALSKPASQKLVSVKSK